MQKIVFLSTCVDDWGGSEELWARSIPYLQENGFSVAVLKHTINRLHPENIKLINNNVSLVALHPDISPRIVNFYTRLKNGGKSNAPVSYKFKTYLSKHKPRLVVIAQGINFDGLRYAYTCVVLKIPYVIISQKAVDFYWPANTERLFMKEAFQKALHCFFVSRHNLFLTEEQFGMRLKNASVVYNPLKIPAVVIPYPSTDNGFRLACVGRLFLLDKGQDILLRILANDKWKERAITISFIGTGRDEEGLKAMAALLNITNVEFKGQVDDIAALWKDYHGFILPSRGEGMPLAVVEAMAAGRIAIVSTAGGNADFVTDGLNGFIGHANEEAFDNTMERAWDRRNEWKEIGKNAFSSIAHLITGCPEAEFAAQLIKLMHTPQT